MPVTFRPAPHAANSIKASFASAQGLLSSSCSSAWDGCDEILQSFLGRGPDAHSTDRLSPAHDGLVTTILASYNRHYALSLRPDDVWLGILVQFQFYVNAHAEELRTSFVVHEGKKEIVVVSCGNRYTVDFGDMAREMTAEMDKHIVDPAVRDWILPQFSTTTPNDTIVAAVLMMATLKAYFDYKSVLMCGIPQVTLEGSKADWEELLNRAAKLKEYGEEPSRWHAMLEPILKRFVRAFDNPHSQENIDFWQKVAHYEGGGSGPTWVSGWITAFCVFGSEGQWIGPPQSQSLTPKSTRGTKVARRSSFGKPSPTLQLDSVLYHVLDSAELPHGYAEVDVKLDDNGEKLGTKMVAGLVAMRVSDSHDVGLSATGESDVVAPVPGWWIFTKRDGEGRMEEQLRKMMEGRGERSKD